MILTTWKLLALTMVGNEVIKNDQSCVRIARELLSVSSTKKARESFKDFNIENRQSMTPPLFIFHEDLNIENCSICFAGLGIICTKICF